MLGLLHDLKRRINICKAQWAAAQGDSAARRSAGKSSIFINTLPKSGSIFIRRSLERSVRLKSHKLAYGYFPTDIVDYYKVKAFSSGGRIAQEHLDAAPLNLAYLEQFVGKWVLHLRDPRGSLLSWVHHLDRLQKEGHSDAVHASSPFLPTDYFERSVGQKIDWQIEHYLKQSVAWISGWNGYYAAHPESMLVTSHNELSADSGQVIARILAFYGMDNGPVKLAEKSMYNHYRKGETDEWKSVYTDAQQARAAAICTPLKHAFAGVNYLVP